MSDKEPKVHDRYILTSLLIFSEGIRVFHFLCLCILLGVDVWCKDLMARRTFALSHIDADFMDC